MAQFASSSFAAGPYDAVIGASSVSFGLMKGDQDSPMLEIQRHVQLINNTHKYGKTPIGAVGQGGEAFLNATLEEYLTSLLAIIWPYTRIGKVPSVGVDDYDSLSQTMILTRQGTVMASTPGPATVTCKGVLAEDYPLKYVFGPVLREIPIRMRIYPNDSTNLDFFTVT